MNHPSRLAISPETLAKRLTNLRYDALCRYLKAFATEIRSAADRDSDRGRDRLATQLYLASSSAASAATFIGAAWDISEPHMKRKAKDR